MSFIIEHAAEKHKDIADKRLYWKMLKMEIRMFAIRFAKKKVSTERNIELDLLQKLEEMNFSLEYKVLSIIFSSYLTRTGD